MHDMFDFFCEKVLLPYLVPSLIIAGAVLFVLAFILLIVFERSSMKRKKRRRAWKRLKRMKKNKKQREKKEALLHRTVAAGIRKIETERF